MGSEELKLPDIETLTMLSGLPEGMRAQDMLHQLEKDIMRMGKSDKEAAALVKKLMEAFAQERDKAVEACYMAGYLKGMSDMAQRFRNMLEARGEINESESRSRAA
jgi:uncharacterized membrane-anchored protein